MDERSGQHMEHMQENTFWRFPKEQWFKESQNPFCLHELRMFYTYFREKVLLNQHKLCIFHDKMQGFCLCKEP